MTDSKLKELQDRIETFKEITGIKVELEVSGAYKMLTDYPEKIYPNSGNPGVYIFSCDDKILYIGHSKRFMGNRISSHLVKSEKEKPKLYFEDQDKESDTGDNLELHTIPFIDKLWYLAPALEGYLIENYRSEHNDPGRR